MNYKKNICDMVKDRISSKVKQAHEASQKDNDPNTWYTNISYQPNFGGIANINYEKLILDDINFMLDILDFKDYINLTRFDRLQLWFFRCYLEELILDEGLFKFEYLKACIIRALNKDSSKGDKFTQNSILKLDNQQILNFIDILNCSFIGQHYTNIRTISGDNKLLKEVMCL